MPRRLALLTLTIAALLPAASASAAPQAGVNLDGIPTDAQLDQAAATGAKTARMFVLWAHVEPSAPTGGRHAYDQGLLARYDQIVARLSLSGMKPIFVLTGAPQWASGSGNVHTPPTDPNAYAAFAHDFAARYAGKVAAYEVWNEPDESDFWSTGRDAARYTALLRPAYAAMKAADPGATVLMGPLVGNDYDFLEQVYANGGQGSFDGVAVHTDTACLDRGPGFFYREADGRLGRFTFLAYREVRATMLAHGDDKPIWMTEVGWSSTATQCGRGAWAGQKPAGVSEADQGAFLEQAYHCLAGESYLQGLAWFTMRDLGAQDTELNRYGLLRTDGSRKPAWDAFHAIATRGDMLSGPCGDFDGPAIRVLAPTPNVQFVEKLVISASLSDPGGLRRIRFSADGKAIFNQVDGLADGVPVTMTYFGSKDLAPGRHTITVEAVDTQGNTSHVDVPVVKVRTLGATLPTLIAGTRLRHRGLKATLSGRVKKSGELGLGGRVRVQWQWRGPAGWKKVHGGLKSAKKPFVFRQKLKRHGRWRVQVKYLGAPPYKASASRWLTFRA